MISDRSSGLILGMSSVGSVGLGDQLSHSKQLSHIQLLSHSKQLINTLWLLH